LSNYLNKLETYTMMLASSGSPEIGTIWKAVNLLDGHIEHDSLQKIALEVIKHNHKRYNDEAGCFNCEMEDWLSFYEESYQKKMISKKSDYFEYFTGFLALTK
jgi:hypothetical protein